MIMEESVKIDKVQLDRLRKFCKENNYKLGGSLSVILKHHMDKVDKRKQNKK